MTKKKEYDIEYMRTHCKRIYLLLNNDKDKDIIDRLAKEDSVNAYLKALIREDIKKG